MQAVKRAVDPSNLFGANNHGVVGTVSLSAPGPSNGPGSLNGPSSLNGPGASSAAASSAE
jgi:hypothetical protein